MAHPEEIKLDLTLDDREYQTKLTVNEMRAQAMAQAMGTAKVPTDGLKAQGDVLAKLTIALRAQNTLLKEQVELAKKGTTVWQKLGTAIGVAANIYTVLASRSSMILNKMQMAEIRKGGSGRSGRLSSRRGRGAGIGGILTKLRSGLAALAPALGPFLVGLAAVYVAFKVVSGILSAIVGAIKLAFSIVAGVIKTVWALAKTAFQAIAFIGGAAFKAIGVAAEAAGKVAQAVFEQMRKGFEFNADQEQSRVTFKLFAGTGDALKDAQKAADIMRIINKEGLQTPVKTDDLVESATKLLPIVQGSTKEMLKQLRIAERMAASTPGKRVEDATDAIIDYVVSGEKERLKEFNIVGPMLEASGKSGADAIDAVLNKQNRSLEVVRAQSQTYTGLMSSIASFIDQIRGAFSEVAFERTKGWMQYVVDWIGQNGMAALEYAKELGNRMSAWIDEITTSKGPGLLQWVQTAAMTVLTWYEYIKGAIASQNLKQVAIDWLRTTGQTVLTILIDVIMAAGRITWRYLEIGIGYGLDLLAQKVTKWLINSNPIFKAYNLIAEKTGQQQINVGQELVQALGMSDSADAAAKGALGAANAQTLADLQTLGGRTMSSIQGNYAGIGTRTYNALGMGQAAGNAQQDAARIEAFGRNVYGDVQAGFLNARARADAADAAADARLAQEGVVNDNKKPTLKEALKAAKGQTGYHLRITSLDGSVLPAGLT